MIGRTLNHYKVIEKLGSGGMGEVYLAEDTRLNRRVALKILPSAMAADPELRGRFEREAQAVAALNHPNIVTIHSVEEAEGLHYITMELIQGRTLSEMIPAEGLPLAKFFDLAIPIADAVSAAHKRGITHRDLKPDNIMVSDDGRIKILDFGLVKLREQPAGEPMATNLPTAELTAEGKILGTVAYMSPEQAEGKPVDHRTDIFSLGVVFYRMVTGRRPFEGGSRLSILSSILRDAPVSVTDLNPALPRHLGRIVKRCLAKDPDERYQTAQDLKNEMVELRKEVQSGTSEPALPAATAAPAVRPKASRGLLFALGAGLVGAALLGYFLLRPGNPAGESPAPPVLHGTFTQLTDQPGEEVFPSLSPDGRMVAYASRPVGNWDVFVQSISGRNAINLTKDSAADDSQPAFSPDGQKIAFRSDREGGGIFVMGVLGDSVVRLTDEGYRPAWSPDGSEIAYELERWVDPHGRSTIDPLWAVNVETRQKRKLSDGDAVQPAWSPHGSRIAYWAVVGASGQRDLYTIPAVGGQPVRVTEDEALDWSPVWSADGRFLYFISDRDGNMNVWRVPIDESTGKIRGAFQPVTQAATGTARDLRVSADGNRLVYGSAVVQQNIQRYSMDSRTEKVTGDPVWITRGSENVASPEPSPDGEWVAFHLVGKQEDIVISRADGSARRQLTHDAARDRMPRWSPDGKRIAFYSDRSGSYEIWTVNPDGSGLSQITQAKTITLMFPIWSPDGQRIAFRSGSEGVGIFDPNRRWTEQKVEPLPPHGMGKGTFVASTWSPDGSKLAGVIYRGTDYNTGVVVYDLTSRKYSRLTDSGSFPTWLNDSRRLIMTDGEDRVFLLDSQTKSIKPILSVAPDRVGPFSLRLSRDNRGLFLVRVDRQSDLVMLTLR